MPLIDLGGFRLRYELDGEGPLVVLNSSGRAPLEETAELRTALGPGYRVLRWDRRGTGRSDLYLAAEPTEQEVAADDLAALMTTLELGPAHLVGGSAGARTSVLAAVLHPEVVKSLSLLMVSGGQAASQAMGYLYHRPLRDAALTGGMGAVATTPYFAALADTNPEVRQRLQSLDPAEFIAIIDRWNEFWYHHPDRPMIGATEQQLRRIAVPTLVFDGVEDLHPSTASHAVAACIPGARLVPAQWTTDEWNEFYYRQGTPELALKTLGLRTADLVREFIDHIEGN